MSTHDPGGIGAGGEHGDEHLASSGRADSSRADLYMPGAVLEEPAIVDVADVRPELANPELVDAMVAPDRTVHAKVGEPLLQMQNVTVQFGGLVALDDVSFDIRRGEILGLIGPNGAGKTTAFNAMTGVYRPTKGQVVFDGSPVGKLKRYRITQRGIARTFQNIRLFNEMTALENVVVGSDARHRTSVPGALFRTPRPRTRAARAPGRWRRAPRAGGAGCGAGRPGRTCGAARPSRRRRSRAPSSR